MNVKERGNLMNNLNFNGKYLLAVLLAITATSLCCTIDIISKNDEGKDDF